MYLARTPARPADWQNPLSYQYWTGGGWSPYEAAAAPALPGSPAAPPSPPGVPASPVSLVHAAGSVAAASLPLGISVGAYAGRGLVMVEQTSLAGAFELWQARSPAGPWRPVRTGRCRAARRQRGADALCRALIGHPELSTRSQVLISYFNPGNDHVDLSAFSW